MVYNPRRRVRRLRKRFSRKPTVAGAKSKATTKKITRVVKQAIARNVETKVIQYNASLNAHCISSALSQAQFNGACFMVTPNGANLGPGVIQGYPIIANGVGQDQRVGDEIKIKSIYINYLITANGYHATTNPNPRAFLATVWVIRPKRGQQNGLDVTNIQVNNNANFYENQFGADSGMIGSTVDMLKKVDRDNYQIMYCKTHKIGYSGTLNTTNVVSSFQNNDFKQFVRDRIKLKGMVYKFDRNDFSQMQPMFLFVQCMAADGTVLNPSIMPASFVFNEAIYYTDA